jgi:hypothetical protein
MKAAFFPALIFSALAGIMNPLGCAAPPVEEAIARQGKAVVVAPRECSQDPDCVPATCCHATSCVGIGAAPPCERVACTEFCAAHTLDCNQGSCACVDGQCATVVVTAE